MNRILFSAGLIAALAQTTRAQATPTVQVLTATKPTSSSIPEHELFRHFLKWVAKLDTQSREAGGNDSYAFATPFASKLNMSHQDLDLLRREAAALEAELGMQDGKVAVISHSYRLQVRAALDAGVPLPAIPPEVHRLSSQRAAIIVNHMAYVKSHLSAESRTRLETYMSHDFAPHVGLKFLGRPPSQGAR